jgi:hypothetical protein
VHAVGLSNRTSAHSSLLIVVYWEMGGCMLKDVNEMIEFYSIGWVESTFRNALWSYFFGLVAGGWAVGCWLLPGTVCPL